MAKVERRENVRKGVGETLRAWIWPVYGRLNRTVSAGAGAKVGVSETIRTSFSSLDFSHLTEKGIDTLLTHPLKMR